MSIVLEDALKELALRPGEHVRVTVDDYQVEIRRADNMENGAAPMLNLWLDVPPSPKTVTLVVSRGSPQMPAPIEITESDLAPECMKRPE